MFDRERSWLRQAVVSRDQVPLISFDPGRLRARFKLRRKGGRRAAVSDVDGSFPCKEIKTVQFRIIETAL